MNVIDMFEFEGNSYRRQLKALYNELDQTCLSYEIGTENRKHFFRRMQGRFIYVCRLKREVSVHQALDFLKISGISMIEIESGLYKLTDREFGLLVTFLGCSREIPIFIEKMEKAMIPGLREDRKKMESTLKKYGFRFADSDEN